MIDVLLRKMMMAWKKIFNLLSLICLCTAQQKWTKDTSEWDQRGKNLNITLVFSSRNIRNALENKGLEKNTLYIKNDLWICKVLVLSIMVLWLEMFGLVLKIFVILKYYKTYIYFKYGYKRSFTVMSHVNRFGSPRFFFGC